MLWTLRAVNSLALSGLLTDCLSLTSYTRWKTGWKNVPNQNVIYLEGRISYLELSVGSYLCSTLPHWPSYIPTRHTKSKRTEPRQKNTQNLWLSQLSLDEKCGKMSQENVAGISGKIRRIGNILSGKKQQKGKDQHMGFSFVAEIYW